LKLSDLYPGDRMGDELELSATVLSVSAPLPRLKKAAWECRRCGSLTFNEAGLKKAAPPYNCADCNRHTPNTAFKLFEKDSVWSSERWADLVEPPEEMRQNRPQRTIPIRLTHEEHVVDGAVEQGHYIKVFGRLLAKDSADSRGNWKATPPVYLDVGHLEVMNKIDVEISDSELEQIKGLANLPNPLDGVIVPSIAPDVEGHEEPKAGLACVMFGGVDRQVGAKKMRGTIHQAMFGDPGTAKTRLLKYVHKAMPRSQYATGPGATDKGLTAVLDRDERYGGYSVKAGLLPMAHDSIAMIDEVGQFTGKHWKAIEECMELQQVTRTGGGEHLPLKAKTSIIVAGNPERGKRWSPSKPLQDQIAIPDSTLSRFDLVFLILDDPKQDEAIREAIDKYHGVGELPPEPEISVELLRKYISHARKLNPKPLPEATEIFHEAHRKMREEVEDSPFTIRTYESYLRLGQALARMRLSTEITANDANRAVRIHHAGWAALLEQEPEEEGSGSQLDKAEAMLNYLTQNTGGEKGRGMPMKIIVRDHEKLNWTEKQVRETLKKLAANNLVLEPTIDDMWRPV